jgi:hypothetical protein
MKLMTLVSILNFAISSVALADFCDEDFNKAAVVVNIQHRNDLNACNDQSDQAFRDLIDTGQFPGCPSDTDRPDMCVLGQCPSQQVDPNIVPEQRCIDANQLLAEKNQCIRDADRAMRNRIEFFQERQRACKFYLFNAPFGPRDLGPRTQTDPDKPRPTTPTQNTINEL